MQKDDMLRLLRDPELIPPEKLTLLLNIAAEAHALNMPCYVVGGFVRDLLLGKPVNDLDIIVEGDAIKLGRKLVETYGGKLTPHFKFHTAIWHLADSTDFVDLITAREETYEKPGALPTVTPSTIEEDLRRRDFTINAVAVRLDGEGLGEILDPLEGQSDLGRGAIRVLHPLSFVDDPTRIFRAIRYEGRYGFSIAPETSSLINAEALKVLRSLSGERIRHELDLVLDEGQSVQMLVRASELGALEAVHPKMPEFDQERAEYLDMDARLDIPADRRTMGYMLWFMDLSEEDVILLANRLDFTNELTLAVWSAAQLMRGLPHLVDMKPSEWTYALEKLPLLSTYAVYLVSRENDLLSYISVWRHVKPHTTGDDLKAKGLTPGPRYGEILLRLRSAWLDGEVVSESQEMQLLASML
ncbi:hypothetical protein MASR2M66_08460 [Chloroflexota bacterium]